MPRVTSRVSGDTPTSNGAYPKLMRGNTSGTIYLLTAPKTGVIVHLGDRPWVSRKLGYSKHKIGYYSTRFKESDMTPFNGSVELRIAS